MRPREIKDAMRLLAVRGVEVMTPVAADTADPAPKRVLAAWQGVLSALDELDAAQAAVPTRSNSERH